MVLRFGADGAGGYSVGVIGVVVSDGIGGVAGVDVLCVAVGGVDDAGEDGGVDGTEHQPSMGSWMDVCKRSCSSCK